MKAFVLMLSCALLVVGDAAMAQQATAGAQAASAPTAKASPPSAAAPGSAWVNAQSGAEPPSQVAPIGPSSATALPAFPASPAVTAATYGQAGTDQAAAPAMNGAQTGQGSADGMAPLPPLNPADLYTTTRKLIAPYTPSQIPQLHQLYQQEHAASALKPIAPVPKISSITVSLAPGASLPIVRTMAGYGSSLVFTDATGAPWPLQAPPTISSSEAFHVQWLPDTGLVMIWPNTEYGEANLVVVLKGMDTPIMVQVINGNPTKVEKTQIFDARLDLRIAREGPNARAPVGGSSQIALYDHTMQSILDGVPPDGSHQLTFDGSAPGTTIYEVGQTMYVRTPYPLRSAFEKSMAAADGTSVYSMPPSPIVTLSAGGQSVPLSVNLAQ